MELAFAAPGADARREAQRLLDSGARVLVVANADHSTGAQVEALARARRVPVIAYERLSAGGAAGYLVSYDFVQAGRLMGDGLLDCLRDADVDKPRLAELNGPAADDEATHLKQGYDGVLNPRYSIKAAVKVSDRSLPAGGTTADARRLVAEMLAVGGGRLDGIVAASDELAGAAIQDPGPGPAGGGGRGPGRNTRGSAQPPRGYAVHDGLRPRSARRPRRRRSWPARWPGARIPRRGCLRTPPPRDTEDPHRAGRAQGAHRRGPGPLSFPTVKEEA